MTDKEKVINDLEWILEDDRFGFGQGLTKPETDEEQAGCIIRDVIALLKEQEAIESINFGDRTEIMANLEGLTWDDWRLYHSDTEVQNIAKSAFDLLIELLKEQEAAEPISFMDGIVERFACKKCGKHLLMTSWGKDNYCSKCGQKVKWE